MSVSVTEKSERRQTMLREESAERALRRGDTCLCIDGRIDRKHPGAVYLLGSGILQMVGTQEEREQLAQDLKAAGVTKISSHSHCGAAAVAFERVEEPQGKKPTQKEIDAFADQVTRKFCEEFGIRYGGQLHVEGKHREAAVFVDLSAPEDKRVDPVCAGRPNDFFLFAHAVVGSLAEAVSIALGIARKDGRTIPVEVIAYSAEELEETVQQLEYELRSLGYDNPVRGIVISQ